MATVLVRRALFVSAIVEEEQDITRLKPLQYRKVRALQQTTL